MIAHPQTHSVTHRFAQAKHSADSRAGFTINTHLQNFSLIAWAVPAQRLSRLIPASFRLEETLFEGQRKAWVSVASCVDEDVEQTAYRLHVKRNGEPAQWLLGISLGALSAVATRNLWPMPWHLSAMELTQDGHQIALRTQSQWANASWRLDVLDEAKDEIVHLETIPALPASLAQSAFNQYFQRRDGALGWQRVRLLNPRFTLAEVKAADCDRLRRLGILSVDELLRPRLAISQRELAVQLSAPSLLEPSAEIAFKRAA